MRRRVAAAGAAVLCTLCLGSAVAAGAEERPQRPGPAPIKAEAPGFTYTYRAEGAGSSGNAGPTDDADTRPAANAHASTAEAPSASATSSGFVPPPNEDFVFDFEGATASQRAVFEAAGGIWSDVLEVEVPIHVRVSTVSFPNKNILGGAEPTNIHANEVGLPVSNVWFVAAHANQFVGRDLDPSQPEINVVISADFDFYEGVDDNVPANQISLLYLALHEIGHGLGHITLARQAGSSWSITWPTPSGTQLPLVYDLFLLNGARTPLTSLSGDALGSALTSRVLWRGAEGIAADGGLLPVMYAPSRFQPGSSTSHLDEVTYPRALMTPDIADGEAHLEIPDLTQAMFADFGWGLEVSGPDESFVTALSRDFLHSFPTPTRLDRWVGLLQRGMPRRDLVAAFANSDAYLGRLLDGYYLSTLGRAADPAGKLYWTERLREGRTPASVAAGFYASGEYFRRSGGTNRSWVTDLYVEILGRQPDQGGLATWVGKANAGADRTAIAHSFYQSTESRTKRVTDLYRTFLGRAPDPGGLDHWRRVLTNGRDVHLAIDLARSSEYQHRAVQRYG